MVYASSGQVDATDYNTLIGDISSIFGTGTGNSGYGGNSTNVSQADLATVAPTASVLSSEWKDLRNTFLDLSTHQNTVLPAGLPALNLLDIGDLITFFSQLNSVPNIDAVNDNKLNVNAANLTLATKLSSVRVAAWGGIPAPSVIQHEFTVDFGSENNARHFFNTGGELRLSATRVGGSGTAHNASWTAFVAANSPYIFTGTDYFALTTGFVVKRLVTDGGAYSLNTWTIRAKADSITGSLGAKGSLLRFQSDFCDGYFSIVDPALPPGSPTPRPDSVDGTFTSTIQERRSTGVFVRSSPTFATTSAL